MPVPTTVNVPHPRGQGYGLALGTALFRPAWGPGRAQQIQTAPLEAPPLDTRVNAEEMTNFFIYESKFREGEGEDYIWSTGPVLLEPLEPRDQQPPPGNGVGK